MSDADDVLELHAADTAAATTSANEAPPAAIAEDKEPHDEEAAPDDFVFMDDEPTTQPGANHDDSVDGARTVIEAIMSTAKTDAGALYEEHALDALLIVQEHAPPDFKRIEGEIQKNRLTKISDLRASLKSRALALRRQTYQATKAAVPDARLRVDVGGDLDTRSKAMVSGLVQLNEPPVFFTVSGRPVHVPAVDDEGARRRIEHLTWQRMRALIGERIACVRRGVDLNNVPTEKVVDAERDVAENVLALSAPPFPPLDAIVRVPFIGRTGVVHATPGYVPEHRVVLDLSARGYDVPSEPTWADVEAAKQLIVNDLLGGFPFADPASRANAVALGLTLVTRPIIAGPSPLFVAEASKQRTGKTLLIRTITAGVTGSDVAIGPEPENDDEWRKRITTTLISAPAIAVVDNVKHPIRSGALAAVLTTNTWDDRVLGKSQNVTLRATTVWAATGNNVAYDTDIAHRVAPIRLQVDVEDPGARTGFVRVLPTWARVNHARLASAFLTLASYGLRRPATQDLPVFGGYEEWVAVVGGILAACGITGFLGNLAEVRGRDLEGSTWRSVVEIWASKLGTAPIFARELLTALSSTSPELVVAVLPGAEPNAPGSARRLSDQLRRRIRQVWGQWQIDDAGLDGHEKVHRFQLKPVGPPATAATAANGCTATPDSATAAGGANAGATCVETPGVRPDMNATSDMSRRSNRAAGAGGRNAADLWGDEDEWAIFDS